MHTVTLVCRLQLKINFVIASIVEEIVSSSFVIKLILCAIEFSYPQQRLHDWWFKPTKHLIMTSFVFLLR